MSGKTRVIIVESNEQRIPKMCTTSAGAACSRYWLCGESRAACSPASLAELCSKSLTQYSTSPFLNSGVKGSCIGPRVSERSLPRLTDDAAGVGVGVDADAPPLPPPAAAAAAASPPRMVPVPVPVPVGVPSAVCLTCARYTDSSQVRIRENVCTFKICSGL